MVNIGWDGWNNLYDLSSNNYICGYCGDKVGAHKGYYHNRIAARIYICPNCGLPTFFYGGNQHPGPLLGKPIRNLPVDVESIYSEIRESVKVSNYTSAVLLGRKLIMHIAVTTAGAEEGKTFKQYVQHLSSSHYIPPNADKLLEYIRELGNEKNHEIKIGLKEEAERILKFIEALLYFVYELEEEFSDKQNSE